MCTIGIHGQPIRARHHIRNLQHPRRTHIAPILLRLEVEHVLWEIKPFGTEDRNHVLCRIGKADMGEGYGATRQRGVNPGTKCAMD
jgi:hypothetical protein